MKLNLFASLVALPLALAQAPFPIAFSSYPAAEVTSAIYQWEIYAESIYTQPQYTTFVEECASVIQTMAADIAIDVGDLGCDPDNMASAFFAASATPAWYTALPGELQGYVSSIAHAEATILAKAVGVNLSGSEKVFGNVHIMGAVLAAVFVGMLAL